MNRRDEKYILTFFFISGLTGLIYEILWTRMIVKIIGGAPFAITIILTVFMGGLGLGSFIASHYIDRIRPQSRLIKIYGFLELITGIYALVLPALIIAFNPFQKVLYNHLFNHFLLYHFFTFLVCGIILAIPVVCMGATLPLLCRFYVNNLSHLGVRAGRLYGLNTVGAAVGAMFCGFWSIHLLGVWGTLGLAVFLNFFIGISCIFLSTKMKDRKQGRPDGVADVKKLEKETMAPDEDLAGLSPVLTGAFIIFAVSGFCAMAYEVIWTRLLGLVIGPTLYSFTIVLVTFISGLALGSIVFGKWADKGKNPIWLLLYTQVAAALLVLGISQVLGNSQLFFAKLIYEYKKSFAVLTVLKALILFILMIGPTVFLGATFPLVGKIFTRSIKKVGRSIGSAYAINTAGAVLGSFSAGFLLIPLAGKEKSLSLVAGLQLLTALVIAVAVVIHSRAKTVSFRILFLSGFVFVGIALCTHFPKWNHLLLASGKYFRQDYIESAMRNTGWFKSLYRGPSILTKYDRGEILYYGEGIGGFTTVMRTPNALGYYEYSLANSGKMDASSRGDMKTQVLSAHFPLLLHKSPKSVMILGLASGITAGEVLCYPVDRLDVLEINQQVIPASNFFRPWNSNVLDQPKTHLIVQDARAHLQLTSRSYDVIISEPSNPWMAGLATLFTKEFFNLAKRRLNQTGIFVQWLHSYSMNWKTFALVGRTFARIFPKNILVSTSPFPYGHDFLFIGFKGKSGLPLDNTLQNFLYSKKSKNMTLRDPRLLYRLIISENMADLFGPGPVNTDNRPRLEYASPKLIYQKGQDIKEKLEKSMLLSQEAERKVRQTPEDVNSQIQFAEFSLSLYMPFPNMVNLSQATASQKEHFFQLMENYCAKNTMDYSLINSKELSKRCRSTQIQAIESRIKQIPDKDEAYFYLANMYFSLGRMEKASSNYRKSLKINADNAYAHNNLGYLLMMRKMYSKAVGQFQQSLRIMPDVAQVHRNLGFSLAALGKLDEASREYRKAIQLWPTNHTLYNDLGVILFRQNRLTDAIEEFKQALRIKPDFSEAQRNLSIAQSRK